MGCKRRPLWTTLHLGQTATREQEVPCEPELIYVLLERFLCPRRRSKRRTFSMCIPAERVFPEFSVAVPDAPTTVLPHGPAIADLAFREIPVALGWIEEEKGRPNTLYITRFPRKGFWLYGMFVRADIPYVLVINTDDGPPHNFELYDPFLERGVVKGTCI